jgi:threonine dehydrogenase-like Zn-dependent dehydrogenase
MRGLVLDGVRRVSYRTDLPEPSIQAPGDAVVAVRAAGLCGSDLHPYEGREAVRFGVVPGHEVVGEVIATGGAVRAFRPGDRVLVPFTTSCGVCHACRAALSSRCVRGGLFGYAPPGDVDVPALHGGQAERLRVPLADGTLVAVPEGMTDDRALLLSDNFPTGWYAAERAEIDHGDVVAVVGLGAVGLCAVVAAFALGARVVLAIDPVAGRRRRAAGLGAVTTSPDDAAAALESLTRGSGGEGERPRAGGWGYQGVGSVIEAAGTRAAQALAFSLVRPGGTLSDIAVQTADRLAFTPVDAYDANLTLRLGRAPVRSLLDRILPRVAGGLDIPVEAVVTHAGIALADGPDFYRRFAAREHGLVKAVFRP